MLETNAIMKSINFEFLRTHAPVLADLGGLGETYAHDDPTGALVKTRVLLEEIVEAIYQRHRIPKPYAASRGGDLHLDELIDGDDFRRVVPETVRVAMHRLRRATNAGAHRRGLHTVTPKDAVRALHDGHELARFAFEFVGWGAAATIPTWTGIEPGGAAGATKGRLQQEKKEALQKLNAAEIALTAMREELAKERSRAIERTRPTLSREQVDELLSRASQVADVLRFDEAATRKALVDLLLAEAGWSLGDEDNPSEEVSQEFPVPGAGDGGATGYADYVLHAPDGRAFAVVEAKRTARDPEEGRAQGERYARALAAKQKGLLPVVITTNGIATTLWDPALKEAPRAIYGLPSPDALAWRVQQRESRRALSLVATSTAIVDRPYQLEAIQRVCERFESGHRRALVVLATGTGKTRVAIALCRKLFEAGWCRRVLFLCDRRELRKQALNTFKTHLPDEPRIVVDGDLDAEARAKGRIFLATYPAMMSVYQGFDAGFFDLVIADESHRSIYNYYRDLFLWFDGRHLALTATPVKFVSRNTYRLFGCANGDPTAAFSLDEAIQHVPPYLVPPQVVQVDTRFLRDGVRYAELSPEEREKLDADQDDGGGDDIDRDAIDQQVFITGTTRAILANLMEHGIRDAAGMLPGKSIVFARSHDHAMHLRRVFDESYPELAGVACRVIDHQERESESLLEDFKKPDHPLCIAISVDMLDTGVDVPEVVNLVFAKPVRSQVKFWQMIGRGTRLCRDLFGPGRDKTCFRVFDHWGNFAWFNEHPEEVEPKTTKSLLQRLFEARVELAELAGAKADVDAFAYAIALVTEDLNALLACRSISVQEAKPELLALVATETLQALSGETRARLRRTAAPLMHWRALQGHEESYRFDLDVTLAQCELLRGGARFDDHRDAITGRVARLLPNHPEVRARGEEIARVSSRPFWEAVTLAQLEAVRADLRGVMAHQREAERPSVRPVELDLDDADVRRTELFPSLEGIDLVLYRERVQAVLLRHFADDPVLTAIRRGEAVSEDDLRALCDLVLQADDKANVYHLAARTPETRNALRATLRGLVGLDALAVDRAFAGFIRDHRLSAQQMRFLALVQSHIVRNGGITVEALYDAPFTTLHADGLDGLFAGADADAVVALVRSFDPARDAS